MLSPLEFNPTELIAEKSDRELEAFFGQLQSFLEWTDADAKVVKHLAELVRPHFHEMVDDFYSEILRHAATRQVLQDDRQIVRLKQTLLLWLEQFFSGNYDLAYVQARWQVGRRHVMIGLDQSYATAALGRLRMRMIAVIIHGLQNDPAAVVASQLSVNKLLDLELAIVNAAYQLSFARLMELSAKQQMLQSERLAAIGQMVTGLAHESRNALQRSHACLETLALEIEDRPDAIRLVQRVQNALDHLHTLYEEVRNYAAPIKLDRQTVSLPKLVVRCWQQLEHKWKPLKSRLRLQLADGLNGDVQWDPVRIEQVLTNLFQNAIDASGEAGEIFCEVRHDHGTDGAGDDDATQERSPTNSPVANVARVVIDVSDSGPGISVSPPQRVFEPFFTTKTKGTGLGLAITRRAIQAHGGEIDLVPGTRSTFRITLPTSA
ncbi:MAG: protoglobin domain-containing protein [Pirellulaceae bacterium]|nr:protoglobin domain-containing protein [Pirellulaceae bacterium]